MYGTFVYSIDYPGLLFAIPPSFIHSLFFPIVEQGKFFARRVLFDHNEVRIDDTYWYELREASMCVFGAAQA